MALTKAQREKRAALVVRQLQNNDAWSRSGVTLVLQIGRKRPRVHGRVVAIAPSRAFVLLAGDDLPADTSLGERKQDRLHVPVSVIMRVERGKR